jgi:hypothetical protein
MYTDREAILQARGREDAENGDLTRAAEGAEDSSLTRSRGGPENGLADLPGGSWVPKGEVGPFDT